MISQKYSQMIFDLKNADLQLRQQLIEEGRLFEGYNTAMEELHLKNTKALEQIISIIGYPTTSKVCKEASDAAWIIIQHSISNPEFMKRCADLLKSEIESNSGSELQYAYLTDRIAVFEGRPQRYGTGFHWDESGNLNPNPYDDFNKVNAGRLALGMNSLEEQILYMRQQAHSNNERPPKDYLQYKNAYNEFRKKSGWI